MVILDLEATCWKGNPPEGQNNEIIEFGVATLDMKTGAIEVLPDMFVRPVESEVSEFCTELTSITAEMLVGAPTLEPALIALKPVLKDRVLACWGEYDPNQIRRETKRKDISFQLPRTCINIKSEMARFAGLRSECGVGKALEYFGRTFSPPPGVEVGTAHRGSHDAYNIAIIVREIMSQWTTSSAENSRSTNTTATSALKTGS